MREIERSVVEAGLGVEVLVLALHLGVGAHGRVVLHLHGTERMLGQPLHHLRRVGEILALCSLRVVEVGVLVVHELTEGGVVVGLHLRGPLTAQTHELGVLHLVLALTEVDQSVVLRPLSHEVVVLVDTLEVVDVLAVHGGVVLHVEHLLHRVALTGVVLAHVHVLPHALVREDLSRHVPLVLPVHTHSPLHLVAHQASVSKRRRRLILLLQGLLGVLLVVLQTHA